MTYLFTQAIAGLRCAQEFALNLSYKAEDGIDFAARWVANSLFSVIRVARDGVRSANTASWNGIQWLIRRAI